MKRYLSLLLLFTAFVTLAKAQDISTASRLGYIQLGGGYSTAASDEVQHRIGGYYAYFGVQFTSLIGIEADVYHTDIEKPNNFGEASYLVGPRIHRLVHRHYDFYGKMQGGIGDTDSKHGEVVQGDAKAYGVIAAGVGLDIRTGYHFNIRLVDWDYQYWPRYGNDNRTPTPNHGSALNPTIFSTGVAYEF